MTGWIRLFGISLILVSCGGTGFHLAWRYRCHLRQCSEMEQGLQRLLGEIRFHQIPMEEALRETGQAMRGTASAVFFLRLARRLAEEEHSGAGCTLAQLWQQEWENFAGESLFRDEGELMELLGRELGSLDLEAQLRALEHCLDGWKLRIAELRKEEEVHGRLYRGLGIAGGCFLAILLL